MSDGHQLTRRQALSGAAAVGAGVLLAPAAAAARGDGAVFRRPIGRVGAGATVELAPRWPFALVGAEWTTPARPHLQLRARGADGRWGRWANAAVQGHQGDGVSPPARVGEGLWTGRATAVQVRSDAPVDGLALTFVADSDAVRALARPAAVAPVAPVAPVARSAGDAFPLAAPVLDAGPGQPPIIARQAWAGDDHPPVKPPYYGTVELGIVHHTENPNGYAAADVPALIRAIYEFHVHGRGWNDIGYNFVIDRLGRTWEARQGGVDLPVAGAQAGDWNTISFGVAMLGDYMDSLPSPAALQALTDLLAWKLSLHGVPLTGEVAEVVAAEGVGWTQFRTGEHVVFPRISGHREVDSTDCPGDDLYDHLPTIRTQVAALTPAPARLTLTGEVAVLASQGAVLNLSGRLVDGQGVGVPGAVIELEQVPGGPSLATTLTDPDGTWSATLAPTRPMLVRALHAQSPIVVSPLLEVDRGSKAPTGA